MPVWLDSTNRVERRSARPSNEAHRIMGNSWCIMDELNKQCSKDHKHVHLVEGKAKQAAIYPPELCEAICKGLQSQKAYDKRNLVCSLNYSSGELEDALRLMVKKAVDGMTGAGRTDDDQDRTLNNIRQRQDDED